MDNQLRTPDITPAQIVAIVGAIIGVAVGAGLDISQGLQDAIITLVTVVASALLVGDGIVRYGRATGTTLRDKGKG